mgnify:CR=1 FL=1
MKLSEYLPEVPTMANRMSQLNGQIAQLELMKSGGATGQAPTIGLDHIVNTWVRHQMAYRQQLVMDLQMVAYSVEEIRGPLTHITSEVFRRGMNIKPIKENPNSDQLIRLEEFLDDCNVFDQSLEEVLRQFHFDVNSVDDGFLYLAKEYKVDKDGKTLRSKINEIRRLNPALVEFDLDAAGLPKNAHFMCPIHREQVHDEPSTCEESDCELECRSVMYKYYHRNKHLYLFDSEIIHLSKFSPSETYGWSPILTIFEKALTIIGMDKNLFRYFFERKMPASMMMVFTDDPESVRRERAHIAAQTRLDPNYIPMVAVSSRNQRGRVELLRLFHTLSEMDYLPVRHEIRERIAAMWGVTPAWQGAPEAFGGLSTQTQQLVVMSRVVEGDQRLFHEKVFPQILDAFGVTDYKLEMPNPEEKAEATKISFSQQRAQVANMYVALGFDVKLKGNDVSLDEAEFIISGKAVPMMQLQGEQMAMGIEQMGKQAEMQEEQMNAMVSQQGETAGVNPAPGRVAAAPQGGEGPGAAPMNAGPLQMMWEGSVVEKADGKFGGRTGGRTPDWHDKLPGEERNIDTYFDNRNEAEQNRQFGIKGFGSPKNIAKAWVPSLMDKGFSSPIIKDITSNASQMWFTQDGVDYTATLLSGGTIGDVSKAVIQQPPTVPPKINYNPTGPNKHDTDEDEDAD